jgi:hypothetical protein
LLAIMPSRAYGLAMPAPQLSVRSARARDLAHQLSAREKRPIHAIVEDALSEYASKRPKPDSPQAFLRRLQANAVEDFDLDEMIADNRRPHNGVRL